MSGTNDRERDERAFDKLIVSQLQRERDIMNLDDLPELTPEELAVMDSIPSDIIARLWETESTCQEPKPDLQQDHGDEDCALAGAGEDAYSGFGFYRAPDMDEADSTTLDESRKELFEELKKKPENEDGAKDA